MFAPLRAAFRMREFYGIPKRWAYIGTASRNRRPGPKTRTRLCAGQRACVGFAVPLHLPESCRSPARGQIRGRNNRRIDLGRASRVGEDGISEGIELGFRRAPAPAF